MKSEKMGWGKKILATPFRFLFTENFKNYESFSFNFRTAHKFLLIKTKISVFEYVGVCSCKEINKNVHLQRATLRRSLVLNYLFFF